MKIDMTQRLKFVEQLRSRGIEDPRVLVAMGNVARERFVLPEYKTESYDDHALPIDCRQTISQPYMVAVMTAAMELSGNEKVLEVGTGSGYQTAILAELADYVVSVERHRFLSEKAAGLLDELHYDNVRLVVGDGSMGWADEAPFDRIMVTAASKGCPPALFEQLVEGGIIVVPVGDRYSQTLEVVRKIDGRERREPVLECRFVPLIGKQGWENG